MSRRLTLLTFAVSAALAQTAWADEAARLAAAMRQAERVVVGQVLAVDPAWKVNEYGDQLIVSRAWVRREENFKGEDTEDVAVEVEGGTLGDLTLKVSDMPTLKSGDRAVFLLKRNANGEFVPHERGAGILRIEADDTVKAVGLNLGQVRELARQSR